MTIRNIRFLLFGDYKEIEAQPEIILEISKKLLENGVAVIPGTFQQFNPNLGLGTYERIMFSSSKEKLTLQIGMDTIEITKLIIDNKLYNFKSKTDEFLSLVKKIIKSLNDSTEVFNEGIRVSLIIDVIHDRDKIKPLNDIYTSINNTLPDYNADETFEWNTRAVKRNKYSFLGNTEEVNIVSEVFRSGGQLNSFGDVQVFDTVQTRIDINTLEGNNNPRVNEEFLSEFLDVANEVFSSLDANIGVNIIESNNK